VRKPRSSPARPAAPRRKSQNRLRPFVLVFLAVILLLAFSGCADERKTVEQESASGRLQIVTTNFPPYDFARQITGSRADVHMLLKPGEEPHSFEPSPQDIRLIQNADLFICTGGENDEWVEEILDSMQGRRPETLRMTDCTSTVAEKQTAGMTTRAESRENPAEEPEIDEHVWTSPENAVKIVRKMTEIILGKDKKNAVYYKARSLTYQKQLHTLDRELKNIVRNSRRKMIVFGDRFPFRYLADELGLEYRAAFPGCAADSEPSAETIVFLTKTVRQEKIPIVFTIELSSGKTADTICEITGARRKTLHSCHNLTARQFRNGATYLSLMRRNAKTLKEALEEPKGGTDND
jgi:zinc transport system substrate-binding protein